MELSIETAKELEQFSGKINVPTLIMHGNKDSLTGFNGSKQFAKRVSGDITYKEWDGMFHEIHNEPDQQAVFDYTIAWIRKYL